MLTFVCNANRGERFQEVTRHESKLAEKKIPSTYIICWKGLVTKAIFLKCHYICRLWLDYIQRQCKDANTRVSLVFASLHRLLNPINLSREKLVSRPLERHLNSRLLHRILLIMGCVWITDLYRRLDSSLSSRSEAADVASLKPSYWSLLPVRKQRGELSPGSE